MSLDIKCNKILIRTALLNLQMIRLNLFKKLPETFLSYKRLFFMDMKSHTKYNLVEKITLSEKEQEIFNLFTDFVQEKNIKTTIRVAGGWVRDKVFFSSPNSILHRSLAVKILISTSH